MPVGLIVTEFLTNSLKYGFPSGGPGNIVIVFKKAVGHYELIASDDGVGLPLDVDLNHPKSLGLELVRGLVAQVGSYNFV